MTKLLLTRGLPGSGKDTWGLAWVNEDPQWRSRVNRDELRFNLTGRYVFEDHERRMLEETTTLAQQALVKTLLMAGRDVVVTDTNLTARFVKEWLRLANSVNAEVEFVDFETPLEECLRRNKARADAGGRFVPEDVIRSMYMRNFRNGKLPARPALEFEERRQYTPDTSLPKAYLVDIDGTLARMNGRGPFEWHRVGEDLPIEDVIRVVSSLRDSGYRIIFMSGRDSACRNETRKWLTSTELGALGLDAPLYMRREKDMRRDSIVKHELFWEHVADRYNVVGVIDDRQQVVDMWREIGLTVFQCAKGDF